MRMMCTFGLIGPLLATGGAALAGERDVNVAVVDLALIFEKYAMTRDLETLFDGRRRAAAGEAENRRAAVEAKRKGLQALKPDTRDFAALEEEITRMEIEYEVWAAHQDRRLKADHKQWLMKIYTNVRQIIKEIADASDIDLVLTDDQLRDDAPDSIALRQQILLKKVIYFDERIDLTQAVLTRLNAKYEQDGGAAGLQISQASPPSPFPPGTVASEAAPAVGSEPPTPSGGPGRDSPQGPRTRRPGF